MFLRKWLKKSFLGGILRFFPLALVASGADAAILYGIKSFMDILGGEGPVTLPLWISLMVTLTVIRLVFLYLKVRTSERWLYHTSSRVMAWFLHGLRNLSPRVFHTEDGDKKVEATYESTQVFQNNGGVLFQAVQAILQLVVFLPVLCYISWQLTAFLFAVIVPLVSVLQRKLHKMGPAEESLLWDRSNFRGDLTQARRLFRQWSSANERIALSDGLLKSNRNLRERGAETSIRKQGLSQITEAVSVLAMVLVLGFCALLIQRGWMDGTSLVLFCSAVLLSYKPVKECARVMPQYRSLVSALNVLNAFENLPRQSAEYESAGGVSPSLKDVQVDKKSFKYEGSERPVFSGFSINWSQEKPVLVRGKNGVGKSTFLRLLAGLEQWDDGWRSASLSGSERNVFFLAQDLELPPRRLLLQLLRAAGAAQNNPATIPTGDSAISRFLQFANVAPLLHKTGLSGGERSKVALLWSLASRSKTILLDEPFASIALVDREPLLAEFLDCAAALGKWVVFVSHDVLSPEMEARFSVVNFGDATTSEELAATTSENAQEA
ncbi:ATP-binding cassette domain-containing protein [Fibrobacter sp. UWEL]|uniref:ATP-binding cassette domain-containing protein n=1 Tax=Fibrobacter sp. UWEL TaxID=1896209 RepID=UPI0009196014|nr:ATP-binding cassette domain-containing protein [Fibrobacter sp. UWEL]SHL09891.1 ABC-type multidrug transport system, ATPase and permease component [Fibrobacter sp. UWEL]